MTSIRKSVNQLPVKMNIERELLPYQLLVEIFGFNRVVIENHCGVIKYEPEDICVKTKEGFLHIQGDALTLAIMTREQLVITGEVGNVHFEKRMFI